MAISIDVKDIPVAANSYSIAGKKVIIIDPSAPIARNTRLIDANKVGQPAFDLNAALSALPRYVNNAAALTALGAGRAYRRDTGEIALTYIP